MRILIFVAVLFMAGLPTHAAPATRPTPAAAARGAKLKANVESFQLQLNYHGDQDKPYYDLLLSVAPVPAAGGNPFSQAVTTPAAGAEKIISHLLADGFLDSATDISNKRMKAPVAPCYTMLVRYSDGNDRPEFYERLGWELPLLARLDGLRGVLDGDAAKAMDLLIGRLSGHRREWEKKAAVPPPAPDPIDRLVARLSADPLWQNGASPVIALPPDAPLSDVVARVFLSTSFDAGRVGSYKLLAAREVRIGDSPSDVYTAVRVETNLGDKIVLLRSLGQVAGWWSRVFAAEVAGPATTAAAPPARRTGEADPRAYVAYWLTATGDGHGEYVDLLVSKTRFQHPLTQILPESSTAVVTTYAKDSIWNPDRHPFRIPKSIMLVDARRSTVEVDGTKCSYSPASVRDVIALLEKPNGTLPVHRRWPPLAGGEEVAKLLLAQLKAQVAEEDAPGPRPVPFEVHEGYFVSNHFEPEAPTSFVVLRDRKSFDQVFGAAAVMKEINHRLPVNAFDGKMVFAAVRRGKAIWTYKVEEVTAYAEGELIIRYTVAAEPDRSAGVASPLIVSVPKRDYTAVRFVENGKLVMETQLAPAKPANATDAFLGTEDRWIECTVDLTDVHTLWGRGIAVHLRGSGETVIRIVTNRIERRFAVTLSAAEAREVRKLCVGSDLVLAPVKDRMGVPDEGRAVITLTNVEGKKREVAKWSNDKVEAFDTVYSGLADLRSKTEDLKPQYEGPYQPAWKPAPPATRPKPGSP